MNEGWLILIQPVWFKYKTADKLLLTDKNSGDLVTMDKFY